MFFTLIAETYHFWLKGFQLVIDGLMTKSAYNLANCMRTLSLNHLLRLFFSLFSDSPIQQAFSFLVQLNAEAYYLSLICLEWFQISAI